MQQPTTYSIHKLQLGPWDNTIHLLVDDATQKAAVIDPAWDVPAIEQKVNALGATLTDIILTHTHSDHVDGIDPLRAIHTLNVHISTAEKDFWEEAPNDAITYNDGDTMMLGNTPIHWLMTPGHTPGSACLVLENDMITGDTLFVYGCGRCDLPGGSPEEMFKTLQRLSQQPSHLVIHPGHTYGCKPTSTLAEQIEGNPFMHWETVETFTKYRMEIHDQIRDSPYTPVLKEELPDL